MGTRGSFPGGKAYHSPPSSAEVKNAWSYTSTPQYIFMTWCLVKHRDFTFAFIGEEYATSYLQIRALHFYTTSGYLYCVNKRDCGSDLTRGLFCNSFSIYNFQIFVALSHAMQT
jgi:hypothetical protein